MSWCDTCTNTDGAECIACQGWRKGVVPDSPRRLLDIAPEFACACGNVERQGWTHRPDYCWPDDQCANGAPLPDPQPKAPVRLVEGPPRDFGQAQDRYGEHMDRPALGVQGTSNDQPKDLK